MCIRVMLIVVLIATLVSSGVVAADFSFTVKNPALSRTVWIADGPLRTEKLEVGRLQALAYPSVEFLLDFEYKGNTVTLVPGDFKVMSMDKSKMDFEQRTSVLLLSNNDTIPVQVKVNYITVPGGDYMQKSITVLACKAAPGAVLKTVTLEYCRFKTSLAAVVPSTERDSTANSAKPGDTGDFVLGGSSRFGCIDPKLNVGFYFCAGPEGGSVSYSQGNLTISQEVSHPLSSDFESIRATIGVVKGGADAVFKQFRAFKLSSYSHSLNNSKLSEFAKRFKSYFDVCQYVPVPANESCLDGEAHIVNGKGFVILTNSSATARKLVLPTEISGLPLDGELKLTDWSGLETPLNMSTIKVGEKLEIDLAPSSAKVIGINVD